MAWPRPSARFRKRASLPPSGEFNAAILDVNLDGQEIYPVADILAKRGLPFVFVTGYGERSLPEPYRGRPALQKPFQAEQLKTHARRVARLSENLRQFSHERLVGEIEPQRRHRDALLGQRGEIASWRRAGNSAAPERNPVIRIAAPIVARVDAQQFLVALALHGDGNAGDFIGRAIWKIDVHQHVARHSGIEHAPDQIGSKFDRSIPIRCAWW